MIEQHNAAIVRPIDQITEGGPSASASGGQVGNNAFGDAMDGSVDDDGNEVARRPRIARKLQMPTKAKVDAHMTLNADHRELCPDCVAGRGGSHQH